MTSTWIETLDEKPSVHAALEGNIEVDVAVIGSGLTGATTAHVLGKAGKRVALISDGKPTESTTAWTTGFLTHYFDSDLLTLCRMEGEENAARVWNAGRKAIDLIEDTIKKHAIECEFLRCTEYIYAYRASHRKYIEDEGMLAKKLGFDVEMHQNATLPFTTFGCLELKRQAKFHALKYVLALRRIAKEQGVIIHDDTKATGIQKKGDKRIVETEKGTVTASDVVISTYYPFNLPRELFAHTGLYTTYIIEYAIPKGVLEHALYEDTHNPYHYFRVDAVDGTADRLLVGGEDHRAEIPIDEARNFRALDQYFNELLPSLQLQPIRKWSGGILEPLDGLPYIGALKADEHQYVATGFSGTGLTMSRIAAEIISDLIVGRKNEWEQLFAVNRRTKPSALLWKGRDYVGEFFGGAVKNLFK